MILCFRFVSVPEISKNYQWKVPRSPPFPFSVSKFDSYGHDCEAICNGRLWSGQRAEEVEGNS